MSTPRERRLTPEHSGRPKPEPDRTPEPAPDVAPRPPIPEQHPPRPARESHMKPRPYHKTPAYQGSGRLQDKVALITGADSGIGRAVAVLFAREGARVTIVYKAAHEEAERTRQACENEGQDAITLAGDVSRMDFCRRAVERTVKQFGQLDILVNNAGFQQPLEAIEDLTLEQWDKTFRTNVYGCFYMVKAALPHLEAGACIINTGSISGLRGSKTLLDYAATTGAIHAFTRSLAMQLAPRNIRVNCVAPGPVWTPFMAPSFVFLASNADSSYMTGEILTLQGGEQIES
ncbi:MAG: SDR family NAD(P)-dependent oxidoreductase [Candidatus Xenobia bacterium]